MKLKSDYERLTLINQFKILAKLNKEEEDYYNEIITILENGYTIFYSQADGWLSEEMSEEKCKFVLNVLSLYRAIEHAKSNDTKNVIKDAGVYFNYFRGFDGNNESAYMSFSRFLIHKQGKFQEQVKYLSENDDLNSHSQMIPIYERQLNIWEKNYQKNYMLKPEQVLEILKA